MGQRKVPLVIHLEPNTLYALNKTCRYCRSCDLLIAHRDQIEALLKSFAGRGKVTEKDYLVLGTIDRAEWKRGAISVGEFRDYLHDFKKVLELVVTGGGRYPEPIT